LLQGKVMNQREKSLMLVYSFFNFRLIEFFFLKL